MISMFLSAIAHIVGCPPKVIPCENIDVAVEERLHHAVGRDHGADRGVRGGEPLRAGDEVGPDVVALGAEPVADAAEGGDHLVGREQDVVAVADLAHALQVALRRREGAARVLHRLHVHEADRLGAHGDDRLLELVEQERA